MSKKKPNVPRSRPKKSRKTKASYGGKVLSEKEIQFFQSVKDGDFQGVFSNLKNLKNAHAIKNETGGTALHVASKHEHLEIVSLLLSYHFDVNLKNRNGETPSDVTNSNDVQDLLDMYQRRLESIEKMYKQEISDLRSEISCGSSQDDVEKIVGNWSDIRVKKKKIIKELSVFEFERIISNIRKNFSKICLFKEKCQKKFYNNEKFLSDNMTMMEITNLCLNLSKTLKKRIGCADKNYKYYKKYCKDVMFKIEKEIQEISKFLNSISTEYECKKDSIDSINDFVSFIRIITQEDIENNKKGEVFLNYFEKTLKRYVNENKKYQTQKIQIQMKELQAEAGSQKQVNKLKKGQVKVKQREDEIMKMKRDLEKTKRKIFSFVECYGSKKSLIEKYSKIDSIYVGRRFFKQCLGEDLYENLLLYEILCDRSLDDYKNISSANYGGDNPVLIANLKQDTSKSKKILRVFKKENLKKNKALFNELNELARIKILPESKSLIGINCCFVYQSPETKEIKFVVENDYCPHNIFQWIKKDYEKKKQLEELMEQENKRVKREIVGVFKQFLEGIVFIKNRKFKKTNISPAYIKVNEKNELRITNYGSSRDDTFLTVCGKKLKPRKRYDGDPLFAFGVILYECLAQPGDTSFQGVDSFPSYFEDSAVDLLSNIFEYRCSAEELLDHPYFSSKVDDSECISLKKFQEKRVDSEIEYVLNVSKKSSNILQTLLSFFYEMKTLDDLCGKFKGFKYGVDGFGNISPFLLDIFFRQCDRAKFFDGRIGNYLPTDEKKLTITFRALGHLLLKLLLEKRSEVSPVFSPFVFSYFLEENIGTLDRWEIYCMLFDKKYVGSMKKLLNENNIQDLCLKMNGELVTDDNKRWYLMQKYKEKLIGTRYRKHNLDAMKEGFLFTLKDNFRKVKVNDLITFFNRKTK